MSRRAQPLSSRHRNVNRLLRILDLASSAWVKSSLSDSSATLASPASAAVPIDIAQTNSIAHGMDANKDGSIGWQTGEGGLAQAQTHMDLMVKGEGL